VLQREADLMPMVARRLAIAVAAFALAWIAASLVADWLFGSGNVLVWAVAVAASATAYVVAPLRASDG
jgi:hypothetical protein